MYSCTLPYILNWFLVNFNFPDRFSKNPRTLNLKNIFPLGVELLIADRQTDRRNAAQNCFPRYRSEAAARAWKNHSLNESSIVARICEITVKFSPAISEFPETGHSSRFFWILIFFVVIAVQHRYFACYCLRLFSLFCYHLYIVLYIQWY
jgi:hypothetical protein